MLRAVTICLMFLLSSCTWFSRPAPPRATPDPVAEKRASIRRELATTHDTRKRCLLHLHGAVLDLMEGRDPASLGAGIASVCPEGWADGFLALQSLLAGDPWTLQEQALRFLEESSGPEDSSGPRDEALHQLRLLAATLLADADLPDTSFTRRLAAVALRDPSLPVFLWTGVTHLLRELAPPHRTATLGTGLTFSRWAPVPLLGRLHFSRPDGPAGQTPWKDGDRLAAGSDHPARVTLSIPLSCADPGPMLLELRPLGPALVRIEGVLEAESGRTPGVESGVWRLSIPAFTGTRTLQVSLVATPRAGTPRLRLVPSSACGFGVAPSSSVDSGKTPPPWLAPFARMTAATLDASGGSFADARALLSKITSENPRFPLARALLTRMILADPSLLPETARRLALLQTAAFPKDGWSLFEQARVAENDGRLEQAMEKLARLDSAWAIVTRARLAMESGARGPVGESDLAGAPLAGLLATSRHHRVFLTAAAAVRRRDPRLALAYLKPAVALRPDLPDLMQFHLQTQQFPEALAEGLRL
ncbi:MAG: hypothetical protein CVU59_05110, partial [Deltaproteobacteria bacterium HGW-Deltaproteobacteria-17]